MILLLIQRLTAEKNIFVKSAARKYDNKKTVQLFEI